MPDCNCVTVGAEMHCPDVLEHATEILDNPVTAASVKIAPLTDDDPSLVTRMVYVVLVPVFTTPRPSVLVIDRSAIDVTVSVSVSELFPDAGSTVPSGTVIVATFTRVPFAADTVPVTVNVRVPPSGKTGITIPEPCIEATVVFPAVGQAAPPVADPQVTVLTVRPAIAGSLKTALFADEGPLFATMMV